MSRPEIMQWAKTRSHYPDTLRCTLYTSESVPTSLVLEWLEKRLSGTSFLTPTHYEVGGATRPSKFTPRKARTSISGDDKLWYSVSFIQVIESAKAEFAVIANKDPGAWIRITVPHSSLPHWEDVAEFLDLCDAVCVESKANSGSVHLESDWEQQNAANLDMYQHFFGGDTSLVSTWRDSYNQVRIDASKMPGLEHETRYVHLTSQWVTYFGPELVERLGADRITSFADAVEIKTLAPGFLRVLLYEDVEHPAKHREVQWKFRRWAGIDEKARQLEDEHKSRYCRCRERERMSR